MSERMQDVGVRPDDTPKKRKREYSEDDFDEGQTIVVEGGDYEHEQEVGPPVDIAAPEFEASRLHNGQLEFISLVRTVLDPELQARLWPRFSETHFAADTTKAIYKRLQTLNQSGRDWPKLATLALDPALPAAAQAQLATVLSRADLGKPLTHGSITLTDGHEVPLETAGDFEGHVFDLLDSYRITRLAAEQFVGAIQTLSDDQEFDPLTGPQLVERAAAEVLSIRGEEAISDVIMHFGHGTTAEDEAKRHRELRKMFAVQRPRFKTGITGFDEKAGGFQPGEVVLIGSTTGGGKCLTGDAMVFTGNGALTMEEMASALGAASGYTETTETVFGEHGLESATSFYREKVSTVFRLRTALGFESTATAHHRVRVLRDGHIVWEYQSKLAPGDALLVPVGQELWGSKTSINWSSQAGPRGTRRAVQAPSEVTPELARVLGYLVAEGHFKPNKFSFTMYDVDVMDDFVRCWKACFPDEIIRFYREKKEASLPVAQNLGEFFQATGLHYGVSSDRSIPLSVRQAPRHLVVEFLRALFEGDGYMQDDNKKQILYTTTSSTLHHQLKVLLTNIGILTNTVVQKKTATNGLAGNSSTAYTLVIGHKFVDVFSDHIGFVSERKKMLLSKVMNRGQRASVGRKTEYLPGILPAARAVWEEAAPRINGAPLKNKLNRVAAAFRRGRFTKLTASTLADMATECGVESGALDTLRAVSSDNLYVDVVSDVVRVDGTTEVYDLVVPGTNSFSANGQIQHNTAAQLTMMQNMARMGTSVAMLQLELSLEQMDERISAGLASVNSDIIRSGTIPSKTQKKIARAWEEFHDDCVEVNSRFTVYAPSAQTVQGCEMVFKQYPYRVWFIDYVNLINLDGEDAKLEGWQKLSKITKSFKTLAKKYGICIVLAVQVNIDGDGNIDVRYAKAMKEDADIVLVWHMTQEAKEEGVVWWKHLKARQYEAFDFPVRIALEHFRFESFSERDLPDKKKRTLGRKKLHTKDDVDVSLETKSTFNKKQKPLVVEDDKPVIDAALAGDIAAMTNKRKLSLDEDDDAGYEDFDDED